MNNRSNEDNQKRDENNSKPFYWSGFSRKAAHFYPRANAYIDFDMSFESLHLYPRINAYTDFDMSFESLPMSPSESRIGRIFNLPAEQINISIPLWAESILFNPLNASFDQLEIDTNNYLSNMGLTAGQLEEPFFVGEDDHYPRRKLNACGYMSPKYDDLTSLLPLFENIKINTVYHDLPKHPRRSAHLKDDIREKYNSGTGLSRTNTPSNFFYKPINTNKQSPQEKPAVDLKSSLDQPKPGKF